MTPTRTRLRTVRRLARSRLALAVAVAATAALAVGAAIAMPGGTNTAAETQQPSEPALSGESLPVALAPTRAELPDEEGETRKLTASEALAGSGTVTIVAVGDITLGSASNRPSGGARGLLAGVASQLGGGVVLGNLETTLSTGASSKCGGGSSNCFAFQAPPEYARGLRQSGFNVLNVANNHALDYGQNGFDQTIRALKGAGIKHAGRVGRIAYRTSGGVRVAIVGFGHSSGFPSILDIPAAQKLVRKADRRANVVVVTFHGGAEGSSATHVRPGPETFLGEQRGNVVAFSHAVVDAGADLVVGHGPHVLRAMEWYRGRLIAYSLGNFSSHGNFNTSGPGGVSGILRVTLNSNGRWRAGRVVPVALRGAGAPVVDGSSAGVRQIRKLSRQDFGKAGVRFAGGGVIKPKAGVDLPPATVKKIQRQLKQLGYYDGAIDGLYGPGTTAAVRKFQTDAGITVDGKYGPQTKAALARALSAATS